MKITTIKMRIIATIMAISLFFLCVAGFVYSFYDLSRYQYSKKNELIQLVQLLSPLLMQELDLPNDHGDLWKDLVAENENVRSFVLYRSDFTAIDSYTSPLSRDQQFFPLKEVQTSFEGDYCVFRTSLRDQGEDVGYIVVDYFLSDRVYGFRSIILVFVGTLLFTTIVSYFIACFLQSQWSKAITSLVDVAKSIYKDKKYTARAVKYSDDEFGLLTDAFNKMLDEISRHEVEMKNRNDYLESRVETRTAALQAINSRLLNEKTRVDQASLVKSDFWATMSHEVRTPMNGIVASCDLAMAEDLSPKVANYLKIIQTSSRTLLLIINDILDFSKLEAGTLELEEVPFSLAELLSKMGSIFREQALENNIEFTLDVDPKLPDILVGDRGRFQQILNNLLENGIKFTTEGKVALNIVCLEKQDDGVVIECRVRDTGLGLEQDCLHSIFQSFHQPDSSSTRRFGGTGLGLAITRKLAVMMGGRVEVSSQLGQGSLFIVTVRFGWNPSSLVHVSDMISLYSSSMEESEILAGKHVLLMENNEISRGVAEVLLTNLGLTVDSVEDGKLVLSALEQTEYDFVLLGSDTSVLSGCEVIRQIRRQKKYHDLLLVALTGQGLIDDEEKYLHAGANVCLSQPLSQDRARKVLVRLSKDPEMIKGVTLPPAQVKALPVRKPALSDVRSAAEKLGVGLEIYYKVLSTFYREYESVDDDFMKLVSADDFEMIKKKIHSLKGSSSTIGAEKLTDLATAMDILCKSGQFPGDEQIQELLVELQFVKNEAEQFVQLSVENDQPAKDRLIILKDTGLEERFNALAKALDESLYDQINQEFMKIERNITGSLVINLGKMIRMYAYDEALNVLSEIGTELNFPEYNNQDT